MSSKNLLIADYIQGGRRLSILNRDADGANTSPAFQTRASCSLMLFLNRIKASGAAYASDFQLRRLESTQFQDTFVNDSSNSEISDDGHQLTLNVHV